MPRRGRFVTFLLLPSAVCFWILGWILFWVGASYDRGEVVMKEPVKPLEPQSLSFFLDVPEKDVMA